MAFRDLRSRQTPKVSEPPTLPVHQTSFIDASCELSGTLRFCEAVQIDGSIEGRIEGEKSVVIGASGRVRADVVCESIVISGKVEGDIEARRQITFHKGAQVVGQMKASSIVVEEGSRFKGCIVIGEDADDEPGSPAAAAGEFESDEKKSLAPSGPAAVIGSERGAKAKARP